MPFGIFKMIVFWHYPMFNVQIGLIFQFFSPFGFISFGQGIKNIYLLRTPLVKTDQEFDIENEHEVNSWIHEFMNHINRQSDLIVLFLVDFVGNGEWEKQSDLVSQGETIFACFEIEFSHFAYQTCVCCVLCALYCVSCIMFGRNFNSPLTYFCCCCSSLNSIFPFSMNRYKSYPRFT